MSIQFETINVVNISEFVKCVTLNRPEVANAFNTQMAHELIVIFEDLSMRPRETRAIILTGAGENAFCAGGDLKQRLDMPDEEWFAQHLVFERMTRAILNCPVPVIGCVNGAAYGGGCELVGACDFAYAAQNARFALTETSLGIIPGAGGTQTISRALGERRAKELIFSARVFSAEEAMAWGLVNEVYPQKELFQTVQSVAEKIARNGPIAVRQAKSAISRGVDLSLEEGLRFEIEAYNRTVPSQDRREGIRAFNEKRTAIFRDR